MSVAGTSVAGRDVVLYELNEVPWEIFDRYVAERPESGVASLLSRGRCETTVNREDGLQPWHTWPTFHTGLPTAEHKSLHLGQDPETIEGKTIWDAAEENGLKVGIFGPMQSWPAREFKHGGFYVPDTFSRDAVVYPPSLRRFQEFNLQMTREQGFSSDAPLKPAELVLAGFDTMRRGLRPSSGLTLAKQLLRERRDGRYKAARSIFQAVPSFDLYWRLHTTTRPNLSVFFTNHVAGMMHRYWGDTDPDYAEKYNYDADEVFGRFVIEALDVFDDQLARVMRFVDANPRSLLIVASSMGQHPVPYNHIGETYVVRDAKRLADAFGLGPIEEGLAMFPRCCLKLPASDAAQAAEAALATARVADEPLFTDVHADGQTVSLAVRFGDNLQLADEVVHGSIDDLETLNVSNLAMLGINAETRLGGGNTAYHSPAGPLITYGIGIDADASREELSALDAAPAIVELLGLPASALESLSPRAGGGQMPCVPFRENNT